MFQDDSKKNVMPNENQYIVRKLVHIINQSLSLNMGRLSLIAGLFQNILPVMDEKSYSHYILTRYVCFLFTAIMTHVLQLKSCSCIYLLVTACAYTAHYLLYGYLIY